VNRTTGKGIETSYTSIIENLKKSGVNMTEPKTKKLEQTLSGKTFVFTGELKNYSRDEAENKIRELGGNATSSVSKKTDYVVVGENPGSKYKKAQNLNIKILTEKEFEKIITGT